MIKYDTTNISKEEQCEECGIVVRMGVKYINKKLITEEKLLCIKCRAKNRARYEKKKDPREPFSKVFQNKTGNKLK